MSSSKASSPPALHSNLEPVPVSGCLICGAAARHREAIRPLGNTVGVHNMNGIIRQHPHRVTDGEGVAA
ncbi:hypothetical protein ABZY44_27530 [Streptomyces sp. NPDC006544]|uniref:hypothetical protein n=1 Tax=Streptomyces sp. NPDC006544 TaxID=3154583 RepID=UPI0033A4378E